MQILDDTTSVHLSADGGYEGFSRAVQVAAGSTFALDFDALTIPDRIRIWDASTGTVYVDTGFMSHVLDTNFTVDQESEGTLRVAVLTDDPGTAWNLDLLSQNTVAGAAATLLRFAQAPMSVALADTSMSLAGEEDPYAGLIETVTLDAGNGQVLVATASTTSMDEPDALSADEADIEDGSGAFDVQVSRSGDLSVALTVGWRVEGVGDSPVDADDFGGTMPSGVVEFGAGDEYGLISFDVTGDGFVENTERFHIVFFDPVTGTELAGLDGSDAALVAQITPAPEGLITGTDADDTLTGDSLDNTIIGFAGNDVITGSDGDDYIEGGDGNDLIDGGSGKNYLVGGAGADVYRVFRDIASDSQTTIDDGSSDASVDVLDLGEVGAAKLDFIASGDDLVVTNLETLEAVRVVGQFSGTGVEQIAMTRSGVASVIEASSLPGLAGFLSYHLGDGDLRIDANTANSGARLVFGPELTTADLSFYRDPWNQDSLFIGVSDGSIITISGLFTDASVGGFSGVTLPEGDSLSVPDLQDRAIFRGTDGNDNIALTFYDDRVDAGLGDDFIAGGQGSDIYDYSIGDGHDEIADVQTDDQQNVLALHGIDPTDVQATRVGNAIRLAFADGGSVLLDGQLAQELPGHNEIDPIAGGVASVIFDDGTIWDAETIKTAAGFVPPRTSPTGTNNDDVLVGDYWIDDIAGGAGNDQIDGGDGDDWLNGEDGDDQLSGGNGADVLRGGAGEDQVSGGAGDDLLIAGDGDAADDAFHGGDGVDTLDYSTSTSAVSVDVVAGTATSATQGSDTFDGVERLIGSANGDSFVLDGRAMEVDGGGGSDNYLIQGLGEGALRIIDSAADGDANGLVLQSLTPEDVVVSLISTGGGASTTGLRLEIPATGGVIDLPLDFVSLDANGNKLFSVSQITFGDSTVWDAAQISDAAWIRGTAGPDELSGSAGKDTIDAGLGDDTVQLGTGDDVVIYRAGDGNDLISDSGNDTGDLLRLVDLGPDDVHFNASGTDLLMTISQTGEIVTLAGFYNGFHGIDRVHFADGTELDRAGILAITDRIDGTEGADTLIGTAAANPMYGGAGDDVIKGLGGNDTLAGGTGSDTLIGGAGNDTYILNAGDGFDTISDGAAGGNGGTDTIQFGFGISASNVTVTQADTGSSLVLNYGTGDTVKLVNTVTSSAYRIEQVKFADGTVWTASDLLQRSSGGTPEPDTIYGDSTANVIDGGAGDDYIEARGGDDTLIGGTGADTLIGGSGNDTYVLNAGDGLDTISDGAAGGNGGSDIVQFGDDVVPSAVTVTEADTGNSLVLTYGAGDSVKLVNTLSSTGYRVEQASFADGTIWTNADMLQRALASNVGDDNFYGSYDGETINGGAGNDYLEGRAGNDTLIGGSGADTLVGGSGDDTYVLNAGDGLDTISDGAAGGNGGNETIQFGTGISASNVTVTEADTGNSLLLTYGAGDSVKIVNTLASTGYRVEQATFADGTVWTNADMLQRAFASNASDNNFYGSYDGETIDGGAGNDYLDGRGGNDTLIGGTGADTLIGGAGNDTYIFNLGDGQDRIYENESSTAPSTGIDTLVFGVGIQLSDLVVSKPSSDVNDILINIAGTTDSILIDNQDISYQGRYYDRIEQFVFQTRQADGSITQSTITSSQLDAYRIGHSFTDGDDTINGSSGADELIGGPGNDTLNGLAGNDILNGGTGNDTLVGGTGSDTYTFNLGDGQDRIYENESSTSPSTGTEKLIFGPGITINDLVLSKQTSDWNDLQIGIAGTTDSILIDQQDVSYQGRYYDRIEQFVFQTLQPDGSVTQTTMSEAQLQALRIARSETAGADTIVGSTSSDVIEGQAGDDTLYGWTGNDTLTGGTGNDHLEGGAGSDTYIFNRGDGQDTVFENEDSTAPSTGFEKLVFGLGITVDDLVLSKPSDWNDLQIGIVGTSDSILINQQDVSYQGRFYDRIEQFVFQTLQPDGSVTQTTMTEAQLQALRIARSETAGADNIVGSTAADVIEGQAGNDSLYGWTGDDTLSGGAGNDYLEGGTGNDTYIFNVGDGADTITDDGAGGSGGNDTIQFGAGISASNVTVTEADSGNSLVLSYGAGDSVKIVNTLSSSLYRIEQVTFADGTGWTNADMLQRFFANNAGNDTFYGSYDGETINGGVGNDTIHGQAGNDVIIGGAGNDLLDGGTGTDTADYSDHTANLTINLSLTTAQTVATGESDTLQSCENLTGGSGADTLTGTTAANTLNGGAGNDRLTGGAGNDTIIGGTGADTAVFAGVSTTYSVITSGGSVSVVDNQATQDGNDGTDTISGIETLEFKSGVQVGVTSPIVLDLDGQGITSLSVDQSSARFDLDGDGRADRTSWIGPTDGFLFLDRDGNGTLSGAKELSFTDDVPGARSDLDGLRSFDSNADGVLSAADDRFDDFRIWQDRNGNGHVDGNEILSLADAGVASLDLDADPTDATYDLGDTVTVNSGTYTRTDGSTMGYIDAALTYFQTEQPSEQASQLPAFPKFAKSSAIREPRGITWDDGDVVASAISAGHRVTTQNLPLERTRLDNQRSAGSSPIGSARKLALMSQDMASFGAFSGVSQIDWKPVMTEFNDLHALS